MKARSRKKAASRCQRAIPVGGQTSAAPPGNTPESWRTGVTVPKAWPAAGGMDRTNYTLEISEGQSRAPAGSGPGLHPPSDVIVDVDSDGDGMVFWFVGRSR